ncbi:MAG: HlyC/CorC family transporter [Spirochaetales bacterium]|nr:HlyC/CorC family transporter [Spirochaetales bacterium]
MEVDSIITLAVFSLLIIFSAFFSSSETAIFSLSMFEREQLKKTVRKKIRLLFQLMASKSDELLITILTGNMIVNIFATAIYENYVQDKFNFENEMLTFLFPIVSMTGILLLFGELMPKNIAVRNSLFFVRLNALPLLGAHFLLAPLRIVLSGIRWLFTIKIHETSQDRDIIDATLKIGHKEGIINQLELSLFESFFEFNILTAEEVMIPRTEIKGVDTGTMVSDILFDFEQSHLGTMHSLLLVYRENIDHPLGYVEIKDLVSFKFGLNDDAPVDTLLNELHQIPESKKLNQLMQEMKELEAGMAVVVDEYGGTAGVITFKHLVETILSNLYSSEQNLIREIGPNVLSMPGKVDVRLLEDVMGIEFETESRTVGGMVIEQLGEIPMEGMTTTIKNIEFTVVKMQRNSIGTLRVEVKS